MTLGCNGGTSLGDASNSIGNSHANGISTERPGNSWLFSAAAIQKTGNALLWIKRR